MAKLYKVSGEMIPVTPKDKTFTYAELGKILGGSAETIRLPSGKVMAVDSFGKIKNLPANPKASAIWNKEFPGDEYPVNNDGLIAGDAVIGTKKEMP